MRRGTEFVLVSFRQFCNLVNLNGENIRYCNKCHMQREPKCFLNDNMKVCAKCLESRRKLYYKRKAMGLR
jgi:hypothetical protein